MKEFRSQGDSFIRSAYRTIAHTVAGHYYEWQRAYLDLRKRIDAEVNPQSQLPPADLIRKPAGSGGLPMRSPEQTANFRIGVRSDNASGDFRRVLLVGRLDFFGFAIAQQLNNNGFNNIVIADNLDDDRCNLLPLIEFDDVLDLAELEQTLERRTKSLGAFSHVFYFGPWDREEAPLALPKALLASCVEHNSRFISFASASSLGSVPSREDMAAGKLGGLRPQGKPSVMAHLLDRQGLRSLPSSFLAIKHYRVFGPGESSDQCVYGLVKRAYDQIRAAGKVTLPAALRPDTELGRRRHDFLYIKDAAAMAVRAASEGASGICEIGSGESHTVEDVVKTVFREMGREPVIEYTEDIPVASSPEPDHADLSRLRKLGYSSAPMSLGSAVHDYVKEHLETGVLSWKRSIPEHAVEEVVSEKPTARPFVPKKRLTTVKTS